MIIWNICVIFYININNQCLKLKKGLNVQRCNNNFGYMSIIYLIIVDILNLLYKLYKNKSIKTSK